MPDPMTPTTEAGRTLLYGIDRLMPEKHDDALAKIIAIEQEARADTAALVEDILEWDRPYVDDSDFREHVLAATKEADADPDCGVTGCPLARGHRGPHIDAPEPMTRTAALDVEDPEPSCCELACYEDPGCACEGCEPLADLLDPEKEVHNA